MAWGATQMQGAPAGPCAPARFRTRTSPGASRCAKVFFSFSFARLFAFFDKPVTQILTLMIPLTYEMRQIHHVAIFATPFVPCMHHAGPPTHWLGMTRYFTSDACIMVTRCLPPHLLYLSLSPSTPSPLLILSCAHAGMHAPPHAWTLHSCPHTHTCMHARLHICPPAYSHKHPHTHTGRQLMKNWKAQGGYLADWGSPRAAAAHWHHPQPQPIVLQQLVRPWHPGWHVESPRSAAGCTRALWVPCHPVNRHHILIAAECQHASDLSAVRISSPGWDGQARTVEG